MGETRKFLKEILWIIKTFSGKDLIEQNEILDIGCGDDPLLPYCDKFDLPVPYTRNCRVAALTYMGDAKIIDEIVFKKYAVVYSSHLLEDFPRNETIDIIKRWSNLIEHDGLLVLLLPDQQRYLEYCNKRREPPNEHHSIEDFSVDYIKKCFAEIPNLTIFYTDTFFTNGDYNFIIVARKK